MQMRFPNAPNVKSPMKKTVDINTITEKLACMYSVLQSFLSGAAWRAYVDVPYTHPTVTKVFCIRSHP